jgi:hypothetical protein
VIHAESDFRNECSHGEERKSLPRLESLSIGRERCLGLPVSSPVPTRLALTGSRQPFWAADCSGPSSSSRDSSILPGRFMACTVTGGIKLRKAEISEIESQQGINLSRGHIGPRQPVIDMERLLDPLQRHIPQRDGTPSYYFSGSCSRKGSQACPPLPFCTPYPQRLYRSGS